MIVCVCVCVWCGVCVCLCMSVFACVGPSLRLFVWVFVFERGRGTSRVCIYQVKNFQLEKELTSITTGEGIALVNQDTQGKGI